jgi:hypothetical protein
MGLPDNIKNFFKGQGDEKPPQVGASSSRLPTVPPKTSVSKTLVFDGSSLEALRSNYERMAAVLDELKKLNEEHKRVQEANLKLFTGEKDREISSLRKSLALANEDAAALGSQLIEKKKMLEDTTTDLNNLHLLVREKADEVKRRESEIVGVRNDLMALQEDSAEKKSALESLKAKHLDLVRVFDELSLSKSRLEADFSSLESLVAEKEAARMELRKEFDSLRASLSSRLSNYVPTGILESPVADQVLTFDEAAAAGDPLALRVIAGLSQLRAAFVPGAGAEDKLVAVKTIGSALYSAWSSKAMAPVSIHQSFVQWQEFLNAIPDAGYKLVLPDLGQNPSANVIAPAGVTKVSEVQLWIIKGDSGAIYARGVIR